MKKILFLAAFAAAVASCKKEGVTNTPSEVKKAEITVSADTSFHTQRMATGDAVKIAQFSFSIVNKSQTVTFVPDIAASGITADQLANFNFTVKDSLGSIVYRSGVLTSLDGGIPSPSPVMLGTGKYSVYMYMDIASGAVGAMQMSLKIVSSEATSSSVLGQIISFFPYVSMLEFKTISLTGSIDTVDERAVYKFSAKATGKIAIKQFSFSTVFADNGNSDTLSLVGLKLMKGATDVTSKVVFSDQNGAVISAITESTTKVYVTFVTNTGEDVIQNATVEYSIRGTFKGFKHPTDGDAFGIQLLTDAVQPSELQYVNKGTSGSQAKLASTPTATSSAKVQNIILSDCSSSSHSAIFGLSSKDWTNGWYLAQPDLKIWTQ